MLIKNFSNNNTISVSKSNKDLYYKLLHNGFTPISIDKDSYRFIRTKEILDFIDREEV